MSKMVTVKQATMSSAEHSDTPITMNRTVRIVSEPTSPTRLGSITGNKRAFLMRALCQIESEISQLHHAQKKAYQLEMALRKRRTTMIEKELEMHQKRCDYLEELRKAVGGEKSRSDVRNGPFAIYSQCKNIEAEKGEKRVKFHMDELAEHPSKKLKAECTPNVLRGHNVVPIPQPTVSRVLPPMIGGSLPMAAPRTNLGILQSLDQTPLCLLSGLAMKMLSSTKTGPDHITACTRK